MTKDELLKNGYTEFPAKIGTLYIKGKFFCTLDKDGNVDYRDSARDMISLGKANTMEGIKDIELKYYKNRLTSAKMEVMLLEEIIKGYEKDKKEEIC